MDIVSRFKELVEELREAGNSDEQLRSAFEEAVRVGGEEKKSGGDAG